MDNLNIWSWALFVFFYSNRIINATLWTFNFGRLHIIGVLSISFIDCVLELRDGCYHVMHLKWEIASNSTNNKFECPTYRIL